MTVICNIDQDVPGYNIAVAVGAAGIEQREFVRHLQALYDTGCVAGFFETSEQGDDEILISFQRYLRDDIEYLAARNTPLAVAAIDQLREEIAEAGEQFPGTPSGRVAADVAAALAGPTPSAAVGPRIGSAP